MLSSNSEIYIGVFPVWFGNTIGDTNDISTTRGASLALLFAPDVLFEKAKNEFKSLTHIISGASQLVMRLDCKPTAADELASQVVKFLYETLAKKLVLVEGSNSLDMSFLRHSIVSHIVSSDAKSSQRSCQFAIEALKAKSGAHQMETPSIHYIPSTSKNSHRLANVCSLDLVSPVGANSKSGEARDLISESAKERRDFGRERKSDFYTFVLDRGRSDKTRDLASFIREKNIVFSQTLDDLTVFEFCNKDLVDFRKEGLSEDDFADRKLNLPMQLANKIALIYLDGNKFGKLFEACKKQDEIAALSQQLQGFQSEMMAEILSWIMERGLDPRENDMIAPTRYLEERGKSVPERVRFETLLWGGDEMMFAVPAWRAWELMGVIEAALKKFMMTTKRDGITRSRLLSHGISLVFANVKTPIESLKSMAYQLADEAKINSSTAESSSEMPFAWQVGVSEGMDISGSDILGSRGKSFTDRNFTSLAFWDSETDLTKIRASELAERRIWKDLTKQILFLKEHLGQSQVNALLSSLLDCTDLDAKNRTIQDNIERVLDQGALITKDVLRQLNAAPLNPQGSKGKFDLEQSLLWLRYLNGYVEPVEPFEKRGLQ